MRNMLAETGTKYRHLHRKYQSNCPGTNVLPGIGPRISSFTWKRIQPIS